MEVCYQSQILFALTLGKVLPIPKDKLYRPQCRSKPFRRKVNKYLLSAGTRNLDHPSPSLVTDLTKLSCL